MEIWKSQSVEDYKEALKAYKEKTYTEPRIEAIIRDGRNYAVKIEGRDDYMTYTPAELYRNFPSQTGGNYANT